eukprot:5701329-Pleurochrysis_carterae.AAC.1
MIRTSSASKSRYWSVDFTMREGPASVSKSTKPDANSSCVFLMIFRKEDGDVKPSSNKSPALAMYGLGVLPSNSHSLLLAEVLPASGVSRRMQRAARTVDSHS